MFVDVIFAITKYLENQNTVFTVDELYRYLRKNGYRCTKDNIKDFLYSTDYVFSLVDGEFISRSAAFTGKWFSFQPTKEEVEKGYFIIGHRCMPFVNPELPPDSIVVTSSDKQVLESKSTTFSLNLAFDVFAFFGEGYVIPYIFNDKANTKLKISSMEKFVPRYIELTSWPLEKLCPDGKFNYGDRVLCRVTDWKNCVVEMTVQRGPESLYSVSQEEIERENWYEEFENDMLENLSKNGPADSIEQQLAFLFLEHSNLLIKNCGSAEEFLMHTKKIGFKAFGVESRIWRTDQNIPFAGKWAGLSGTEKLYSQVATIMSPNVLDFYLFDAIYNEVVNNKPVDVNAVYEKMVPKEIQDSVDEQKDVMLHFRKRHDILLKQYNEFEDYPFADLRHRVIGLFSRTSKLLTSIALKCDDLDRFPQQELIVLSQLFLHLSHIIDEFSNSYLKNNLPVDDIDLSLDGMEETFDEINYDLLSALKRYEKKTTFRYDN